MYTCAGYALDIEDTRYQYALRQYIDGISVYVDRCKVSANAVSEMGYCNLSKAGPDPIILVLLKSSATIVE
jgi:hypothetical protein